MTSRRMGTKKTHARIARTSHNSALPEAKRMMSQLRRGTWDGPPPGTPSGGSPGAVGVDVVPALTGSGLPEELDEATDVSFLVLQQFLEVVGLHQFELIDRRQPWWRLDALTDRRVAEF